MVCMYAFLDEQWIWMFNLVSWLSLHSVKLLVAYLWSSSALNPLLTLTQRDGNTKVRTPKYVNVIWTSFISLRYQVLFQLLTFICIWVYLKVYAFISYRQKGISFAWNVIVPFSHLRYVHSAVGHETSSLQMWS